MNKNKLEQLHNSSISHTKARIRVSSERMEPAISNSEEGKNFHCSFSFNNSFSVNDDMKCFPAWSPAMLEERNFLTKFM